MKKAMFRVLSCVMLTLLAIPSQADWFKVGESDTVYSYFEDTSVEVLDTTVKVWLLLDFKKVDANGARSQRFQEVFDCEKGESRTSYRIVTKGQMGEGEVFMSIVPTDPATPIPENSLRDTIFQIIC